MKELIPAIRQYKHNDGSEGFVMAYDKNKVVKILNDLPVAIYQYRYCTNGDDWSLWKDCCNDLYKSIKKDLADYSYEVRELIVKLW